MIHLHLDVLGGLAGDMFAAGMLAAFPDLLAAVEANVTRTVPEGVRCRVADHTDGVLTGLRFLVEDATGRQVDANEGPHEHGPQGHGHHDRGHGHGHDHDHDHGGHPHEHEHEHEHRAWAGIREELRGSGLAEGVLRHALGIFGVLAAAEARVHGTEPDAVRFHEVGAVDSIADVVTAATLIDAVEAMGDGIGGWSVSALPLGGGRVRSAHGPMPVPTPATAVLLEGFAVLDDGVMGERVTPTGAAILRWLREDGMLRERRPAGRIDASGTGFGSRRLPGISNCVRVLVVDAGELEPEGMEHRELMVIGFEVDDQSPEELAAGLERVRATGGVHDVLQVPCFGKKSRMGTHVQVLARPEAAEAAVQACFAETTTIGLRTHLVRGRALPRHIARVTVDGAEVAVKLVRRPGSGGVTAKAEADHVASGNGPGGGQAGRAALKRRAEAAALENGMSGGVPNGVSDAVRGETAAGHEGYRS